MDIERGFDMVPRLSRGMLDRDNWARFIDSIKEHYLGDENVEVKPNYIVFNAGVRLKLPFEGHKFLRFSSKVPGRLTETTNLNVDSYIDTVSGIAQVYFGSRIIPWHEVNDQFGHYDSSEVNESLRSYEQRDEPEVATSLAQMLMGGTDILRELDIPLFKVKDIPGKGRGLVARFNISKGTRILCEKPLLTVRHMPPDDLQRVLVPKLKALSRVQQQQFLSLHNNFPGKTPFAGIVLTNALPCGSGSPVGGVYPMACLINHDCLPNAHNNWNCDAEHETIHAVRPIRCGEEITISYDRGGPSQARQAFLEQAFGFRCCCRRCSLPPTELEASDTRRLLMQRLDESIGNPMGMARSPEKSLADCHALLRVLEDEYDGHAPAHLARLYYDAFQICIAHGDQARASTFAERAYKAGITCEGEDSPLTKRMKEFALKPTSHSSFRVYSRKWITARAQIPEGLDTAQFEKWLFRE